MSRILRGMRLLRDPAPGTPPPRDPDAHWNERPAHRVWLPRFFMARYPVTVAQWRAYQRATGAVVDPRSVRGEQTHPVVYVSWRDAVRYCAWLTDALRERARAEAAQPSARRRVPAVLATLLLEVDGQSGPWAVRLPSEAEWEKAARGGTASMYPWGTAADPNRANYSPWAETPLAGTSAVGCFPGGASPYSVEELAGNVQEWTISEKRPYPYNPADGREGADVPSTFLRVVRGAAFYGPSGGVRAAHRAEYFPHLPDRGVGFRVVVAPPFPSDF